jgi:large subunit ribosomal protein L17
MRHGKKFNHLGRKAAHRKSMLANMACSLIEHKRIKTTLAKGKALRMYIEPLITKSKNDTTHSRRVVFSYLKQKEAVTELFGDISSKVSDRNGGYTRILKLGNRLGDNASMCMIELVDYNSEYTTDKPKAKKSRRSRRGGSSSTKTGAPVVEEAPAVEEIPPAEEVVEEAPTSEEVFEEAPTVEEVPAAEEVVEEAPAAEEVVEEAPAAEEVVEEAPAAEEKNQPEDNKNEENKKQD